MDIASPEGIKDKRPALIVTSTPAWNAVKDILHELNIVETIVVTEANTTHWNHLLSKIADHMSEIVYAVGGGLAADAVKYLAARLNLPLVVLPTALWVDAFMTAASGIRPDGCVYYMETEAPENLILDLDHIAHGPVSIRAAGSTDVMSVAIGTRDWKFVHDQGKNPKGMEFIPWVYDNAQDILLCLVDCAEAGGHGDKNGLKGMFDGLGRRVQLGNQVGHVRLEAGSEYYLAYTVENEMGHGLPHGNLAGPAILLDVNLEGQDISRLEKALKACSIPLSKIPNDGIESTVKIPPGDSIKHNLSVGIAHTLQSSSSLTLHSGNRHVS